MQIGELSRASGTPVANIRFYEREGLLPTAPRTEANYRVYEETHIDRLAFIRQCRLLDMSLGEVRMLLRYHDQPGSDCGEVNALVDTHIAEVTQRIQDLRGLKLSLRNLRARCMQPVVGAQCGIVDGIAAAARGEEPPAQADAAWRQLDLES